MPGKSPLNAANLATPASTFSADPDASGAHRPSQHDPVGHLPGTRSRPRLEPLGRTARSSPSLSGFGLSTFVATVVDTLSRSDKWSTWQSNERRLAGIAGLEEALSVWRRRDKRSYEVVAGLTALGSRRGADDDDAALAVVAMLEDGVIRVAWMLSDLCEVDDVRATVWEEVKAAEPRTGPHAARYLLQRAHQRLSRPAAGMVSRISTTSLEQQLETNSWPGTRASRGVSGGPPDRPLSLAAPEVEDPVADLADLLVWARGVGVVGTEEVELIVELLAAENAGVPREQAQRLVGERRGLAMRTIRRRRDATTMRLREAAATYLAETA